MDTDRDHLRLLSIGHYVVGGLTYLLALVPLVYSAVGFWMFRDPAKWGENGSPPPPEVATLMIVGGVVFCVLGLGLATALVLAGRFLGQHRHRTYCTAVAALQTLNCPVGTVLGVFTLVVLLRPTVRDLFDAAPAR